MIYFWGGDRNKRIYFQDNACETLNNQRSRAMSDQIWSEVFTQTFYKTVDFL